MYNTAYNIVHILQWDNFTLPRGSKRSFCCSKRIVLFGVLYVCVGTSIYRYSVQLSVLYSLWVTADFVKSGWIYVFMRVLLASDQKEISKPIICSCLLTGRSRCAATWRCWNHLTSMNVMGSMGVIQTVGTFYWQETRVYSGRNSAITVWIRRLN